MKLSDARKLAIRQQVEIRFSLSDGKECQIDRHGLARVPGLQEPPSFNLEEEFSRAAHFRIQSPGQDSPREIERAALEQMGQGEPQPAHSADHEE